MKMTQFEKFYTIVRDETKHYDIPMCEDNKLLPQALVNMWYLAIFVSKNKVNNNDKYREL